MSNGEFFPPVSSDLFDALVGEYNDRLQKIKEIGELLGSQQLGGVVTYFIMGNGAELNVRYNPSADKLFRTEGAVAALNSDFWQRAITATDVFDFMPQKRREEWRKSIDDMTTPDFEAETVRATIAQLLQQRQQFLCERVDGIFRALSREHVTNRPEGFSKRMILGYATNEDGYPNYTTAGHINDLRAVIAKFMGRDQPGYNLTSPIIEKGYENSGQWMTLDGGSLRMRVYKKGTAHLEVHPDIAYRLNMILAMLYPSAIASEYRNKPKKPNKDFGLMQRPLPFAVIRALQEMLPRNKNQLYKSYLTSSVEKSVMKEVQQVLEAIGGVMDKNHVEFSYNAYEVLFEVISTGCIPDRASHQFYPTPPRLVRLLEEQLDLDPEQAFLEPSAGTGAIAEILPSPDCIEVSHLHCKVLEAKGFACREGDFLALAPKIEKRYDQIVMNPPFSEGRWKLHLEAARDLLKPGGKLTAILPASAKGKSFFGDCDEQFSPVYDNEFDGTSVSVVIYSATDLCDNAFAILKATETRAAL